MEAALPGLEAARAATLERLEEALVQLRDAAALGKQLEIVAPEDVAWRRGLWLARTRAAIVLTGLGRTAEARRELEAARELVRHFPGEEALPVDLALTHAWLGGLLHGLGLQDESLVEREAAHDVLQGLEREDALGGEGIEVLALARGSVDEALRELGR